MHTGELSHKYILVGPSGTGKSTMASILRDSYGMKRCITTTTRPPRPHEIDGEDYHFVSSMDGLDLFERADFGGYTYGITKDELCKGDFLILDPQGVAFYRQHYPGPVTVILLHRNGIDVDAARRARDKDAGFDNVEADFIVCGDTIPEMSRNLLTIIRAHATEQFCYGTPVFHPSLDLMIHQAASDQKFDRRPQDSHPAEHFKLSKDR